MPNINDELLPPDSIVGNARKYSAMIETGKQLANKNLSEGVYPLIEALAKHVEALWSLADDGAAPYLPAEVSKQLLTLINEMFELLPEDVRSETLKAKIAAAIATIGELTEEEEEDAEEGETDE